MTISTNEKHFANDGTPRAEFDVVVRGRIGSFSDFSWLIECRDRKSAGPAPSSWIQQIATKKTLHRFNGVTAVSSTGFSKTAIRDAEELNVDLRDVVEVEVDTLSWLGLREATHYTRKGHLTGVRFLVDQSTPRVLHDALQSVLKRAKSSAKFLRNSQGQFVTATDAFKHATMQSEEAWRAIVPGAPPQSVYVLCDYPSSRYMIDTPRGPVEIAAIGFVGTLWVLEFKQRLESVREYRHAVSGIAISQVATFEAFVVDGTTVVPEIHRMTESGETSIVLRRLYPRIAPS